MSSRRNVMKGSLGVISLVVSSGLASASSKDASKIREGNELQKVDENDSYVLFKKESHSGTAYFKSNKNTGRTMKVEATELSNELGLAQADVSVATVPQSAGSWIVKRSDSCRRLFESCTGDCQAHVVVGTSHELYKELAGATKGAIGAAIVAAALAAAPAGAVAAVGSGSAETIITGALSGIATSYIEGNTFTFATVDTDIDYVFGVDEAAYPGTALGGWKPNPSALLSYPAMPLDTHQGGCD